jgi:hypothetical protein
MDILNDEFISFLSCAHQHKLRYMFIGGYAVNYYRYNRNTADLNVWIAPTNENKDNFLNTLKCMKYSKNEVSSLFEEDFTIPFVGNFGTVESNIDVLTFVHASLLYDEAEKSKILLK